MNETETRARATFSLKIGRKLPICKPPGVGASLNLYSKWKFRIKGNRSWRSLSASTLDNRTALWRNCDACGGYVDQAGLDWLSVWDHFYEAPPIDGNGSCFETVSALTLLAADTAKVRVGCLVFCINYRHPASAGQGFCHD
jgi:hypothetical protein